MISLRDVVTGFGNRDPLAEVWRRNLRDGVGEITGVLPLRYIGNGRPLTDYLISGNTLQDGTPTPDMPVDVVGCGVRTAQLIPEIVQGGVSTADGALSDSSNRLRTNYIPVESGKTYTVSSGNLYLATACYYNNGVFSSKIDEVVATTTSATFTVPETVNQIAIGFKTADGTTDITPSDLQNYMLNEGSAGLPYEPYGYKLLLTANSTEYPIYLGIVPTTRKIKKLVLTGEELWRDYNSNFWSNALDADSRPSMTCICSHLVSMQNAGIYISNGSTRLKVYASSVSSVATTATEWAQYLAQQYAARTPVTVWYVLAEPETTVVNEPLMKIGDYADTISFAQAGVTIPTVSGDNVLDTTSTVKPSEVYIKGRGIKPI